MTSHRIHTSGPCRVLQPHNRSGLSREHVHGPLQPMEPEPVGWRIKAALWLFWVILAAAIFWRLG